MNKSVLDNRNKEIKEREDEDKVLPPKATNSNNKKGGLFSNPKSPTNLGIKFRREQVMIKPSSEKPTPVTEKSQPITAQDTTAAEEIDYSYEDYQVEADEPTEKKVSNHEVYTPSKQGRLPVVVRKQGNSQTRF